MGFFILENPFGEDEETVNLTILLSSEDLASVIGMATESCIRLLSVFKKKGLVFTKGKNIRIENLKELGRLRRDF